MQEAESDEGQSEEPLLANEGEPAHEGASAVQTGVNLLNELEGSGLLGVPYAIMLAGWASLGCMLGVGIMAGYTGYILAKCMYDPQSGVRVRSSYASIGKACFGSGGERFVLVVQMSNLVFVGIVYLVLMSSTLDSVHPLKPDNAVLSHRLWTLVCAALVLPTVHIGGYKGVAILSKLGLLCLAGVFVCGIAFPAKQIYEDGSQSMPPFLLTSLPASFSMFVFAFSAHGIFPDLEASMAEPKHFGPVVVSVFTVNVAIKVIFGLVGVFAFGAATEPIISSNLPRTPLTIIAVLIAVNTWMSFPLPLIPVFRFIAKTRCASTSTSTSTSISTAGATATETVEIAESEEYKHAQQNAKQEQAEVEAKSLGYERTAVVLFCSAVAFVVPDFALAMGFMGSVTLPLLTFIFPSVFYLRLYWAKLGPLGVGISVFVAIVGALGCVLGLASNIHIAIEKNRRT